jgi:hypothetical protein
MENLRAAIERDLGDSIEGEFGMVVQLTSPDGITQIYKKGSSSVLLTGQCLYSSRRENPDTGLPEIVDQAVVTLRVSSLDRVPLPGENWYVKFATSPVVGAPLRGFVASSDRAPEHCQDIGFIKLYEQRVETESVRPVST